MLAILSRNVTIISTASRTDHDGNIIILHYCNINKTSDLARQESFLINFNRVLHDLEHAASIARSELGAFGRKRRVFPEMWPISSRNRRKFVNTRRRRATTASSASAILSALYDKNVLIIDMYVPVCVCVL